MVWYVCRISCGIVGGGLVVVIVGIEKSKTAWVEGDELSNAICEECNCNELKKNLL